MGPICDLFWYCSKPLPLVCIPHWSTHHRQGSRHGKFLNVITAEKSIFLPPQINIWSRNRYEVPLAENTFITNKKWSYWLSSISVRKAVCVFICPKAVFCIFFCQRFICLVCAVCICDRCICEETVWWAGPSNGSSPNGALYYGACTYYRTFAVGHILWGL